MPTATATRSTKPKSKPSIPAQIPDRLLRLRQAAASAGVSHLLVSNPLDVGYLTGFMGGDSYLLVPIEDAKGKPTIVSDFRYIEELEPFKPTANIVIRKKTMGEAVAELLADPSVKLCGVQGEQMTVAEFATLGKKVGESKLKPVTGLVAPLRAIKDAHEIALIERAVKVQEKALLKTLPTIKPGQTELEVAATLEAEMKRLGASESAFQSIVAARSNGSLPHYRPGPAKLAKGQPLLIDWGARVGGYNSDMTRTFSLGKWPAKIREIYRIVLDAHLLAAAALRPGAKTIDVDAAARGHIAEHGYGEYFGHGLGHGIGLNVHEDPRVDFRTAGVELKPGHVVTNEPGIYLPGVGGVRIEDDYLITESGARRLATLPREIEWATL